MKRRWTANASMLFVIAAASLAVACSSTTESTNAAGSGDAHEEPIAASAETKEALGVDHWTREASTGHTVVSGEDERGNVRLRFEQVITTDAEGVTHGVITTSFDGSPMLRYVVSADGQGRVERNDFPQSQHAVGAARYALSDFGVSSGSSPGSLVQTKSLAPLDLVHPGSPLVEKLCIPSLIATGCILAAMCGIGGSSGDEVLAGVAEAGTEQCR